MHIFHDRKRNSNKTEYIFQIMTNLKNWFFIIRLIIDFEWLSARQTLDLVWPWDPYTPAKISGRVHTG